MTDGPELLKRSGLTAAECAAVEELAASCREADGIALPLNLAPAGAEGQARHLLAHAGGRLVGYLGLEELGGIEAVGMVRPDRRRRGIGRALVVAAREELRGRGLSRCLLVCDEAAPAAAPFCAAVGAAYRFAEYRMDLDEARVPAPRPWSEPLDLRPAAPDDAAAIARILAAAFGEAEEAVRARVAGGIGRPDQRYFLARLGDEPVGTLRVVPEDGAAYITAFAVAPDHQGRGHGRQILARALDTLRAEAARPILIEVETDNRGALALYHSCGFVVTRRYGYYELAW